MSLKFYEELAHWWPLISPLEEYEEEVTFFLHAIQDVPLPANPTLLDLGSGGGSIAFYFKSRFTLTLVDIAPRMLAVSEALNPECEHIVGDLRSVRLGRLFDVVFIHDAIDYMTTETELRQAMETAFLHCKPGGVAVFVPDVVRETFEEATDQGGEDGDGRAIRFLEWTFDPDETDSVYITDYVFVMRENETVHVEHDRHTLGLFAREDWLQWLHEAGFEARRLVDEYERDVFIAMKPQ